ncbi:MAG TPA: hypothetical protein VK775_18735 [Chthoniobacterales bacterium]|nr:hypothetical protein [Chthoniobacterales bacterium]
MSSLRILLSDSSKLQRDCQGAFERAVEFAAADYRGLCLRERRWSSGHRWGGAVDFELGAGRCSGDVNVILKAPTTSVARAQLLVAAAFRNSTRQFLVQASDAKVVYVTPALSYLLATTTNPTQPGQVPPNGSLITLVITDRVNGALISRTVAVNFTLAARERLNSPCRRLVLAHPLPKSALIFSNDRQADPWNPAELHARKLLRPKADCRRDGTNANTRHQRFGAQSSDLFVTTGPSRFSLC